MTAHPTHCVKGHPAMWCTCKRFVAAPNGTFPVEPEVVCLHFPNLNERSPHSSVSAHPTGSPSDA